MERESLNNLNMGEIWKIARERGIAIKGKSKKELIKKIIAIDVPVLEKEPEKPEVKKVEGRKEVITFVEATLADGTKVKIPAKDVTPIGKEVKTGEVTIKSVDGRELEVSVGRDHWVGQTITIPAELEDEVSRLLKDGGFYFV